LKIPRWSVRLNKLIQVGWSAKLQQVEGDSCYFERNTVTNGHWAANEAVPVHLRKL